MHYIYAILWTEDYITHLKQPRLDDAPATRLPYMFACVDRRSEMVVCAQRLDKFLVSLRLLRNIQLQNERK